MNEEKENKIIVAIKYNGCDIEEALKIISEYINIEKINTHNLDESKNYIDLRYIDDETWKIIVSDCCGNDKITKTGLFLEKYDDWHLCCLPQDWY